MKGRTRWFPRDIKPAQRGMYECSVRISSSVPATRWMLEWDGIGFLVPCPMVVNHWRGMTKKAHAEATKGSK